MVDESVRGRRLAYAITEAFATIQRMRQVEQADVIRWLAPLMGVSEKTVKRWTTGDSVPDALQLRPLADHLGVNVMLFIDPPEVPDYPITEYLVEQAGRQGIAEGLKRARRPRRAKQDDEPSPQ